MNEMVSIIVPVYNVNQFLDRCLNSICTQTFSDIEIILVDDGSTDGSSSKCDQYEEIDSRIKVIHKENGGLSSARNRGIESAKGKYLFFVDSDDYIVKDCIEYLITTLENSNADMVIGNYMRTKDSDLDIYSNENIYENTYGNIEAIKELFGTKNVQMVTAWGTLYKKQLFSDIRFPEGVYHEDEATTYKLLYISKKIVVSSKIIYAYYLNLNSITGKPNSKNYKDLCSIFEQQIQFFDKKGELVLKDWVVNRYIIQIANHILPINYYDLWILMIYKAFQLNAGIKNRRGMDITFWIKGIMCGLFCLPMGIIMKYEKLYFAGD